MTTVTTPRQRPRPVFRKSVVTGAEILGTNFRRLTFSSETLEGFAVQRPAQHIKVLFPRPGEIEPTVPTVTDDALVYRGDGERPTMRTYTPRHFDSAALALDVDFYLYSSGPASSWARAAKLGDVVVVAGPGGGYNPELDGTSFFLVGDETAIPAIATMLEALVERAKASVLIETADDGNLLTSPVPLAVHFVTRHDPDRPGAALEEAVRDAALPEDARLFVACEASAMRSIRRHLLIERGIARERLHTRGYWKVGAANHPDHDTGKDE